MCETEFYETEDDKCPVQDFLDSQEDKMKAKLFRTIDLLANNGPALREPYSKSIGDGILELRVKQRTDITSVLYFLWSAEKPFLRMAL